MAVSTKNQETNKIRGEAERSDDQDEFRVVNFWWVEESSERFQDNGNTQGNKEDGVEESTEDFGPEPLW